MAFFKLTNLRELSEEQQKQLSGGSSGNGCDIDHCVCRCSCVCKNGTPTQSSNKEFTASNSVQAYGAQQRKAMQNW